MSNLPMTYVSSFLPKAYFDDLPELFEWNAELGIYTHTPTKCANEAAPCSIHHPSPHSMVSFPRHWRGDRGIMERICPHGIGHPDPDDAAFRRARYEREDTPEYARDNGTHGCDGCCFPS